MKILNDILLSKQIIEPINVLEQFAKHKDELKTGISARAKDLLVSSDTTLYSISAIMTYAFKKAWIDWEPETVRQALKSKFGIDASAITLNKILALQIIFTQDIYTYDWFVFEKLAEAVANMLSDFTRFTAINIDFSAILINIIKDFWQGDPNKLDFGPDIQNYVAACARQEGIIFLAEPLSFAQARLNEINDSTDKVAECKATWKGLIEDLPADTPIEYKLDELNPTHISIARNIIMRSSISDYCNKAISELL